MFVGHAFTGVTSDLNTTNTNPPQGRGKSPNLPSNYPDIATSSHQQSQADPDTTQLFSYNNSGSQYIRGVSNHTGYVKGNGNGIINLGNLGTSAFTQSQSVADNSVPISDETRLLSYQNSGNQYIYGVSNQTGYVMGNVNGIFNGGYLGASSNSKATVDLTATVDALRNLIPRESLKGDGTRTQPNSSSPTTMGGENHQPDNFSNTGEQTIEGVTSQTGIIAGNYNGLLNSGCADI
ncbi:hypothetical protein L6164_026172 [Bauhinia variegata]|uniref:Uncharacterized protein n=1 Tax=Bauhinia variegata TaxID=167791 RepID=A0ACB9LNQ2_BAUVA|nr:hypothetical protein L6164_026172 [Bauhinia variegata]